MCKIGKVNKLVVHCNSGNAELVDMSDKTAGLKPGAGSQQGGAYPLLGNRSGELVCECVGHLASLPFPNNDFHCKAGWKGGRGEEEEKEEE